MSAKKQAAPGSTAPPEIHAKPADPAITVPTTPASTEPTVQAAPAAPTDVAANPDPAADPPAQDEQPAATEAPVAPPTPTIGRIVHYQLPVTEKIRPAIIVHVHDETTLDLIIFTNGEDDKRAISERVVMLNVNNGAEMHQVPGVVNRHRVTAGTDPGQWSWPARTGPTI